MADHPATRQSEAVEALEVAHAGGRWPKETLVSLAAMTSAR